MSLCIAAIWYCYQSHTLCTPTASEYCKRSLGLGKKNWTSHDLNAANESEDIASSYRWDMRVILTACVAGIAEWSCTDETLRLETQKSVHNVEDGLRLPVLKSSGYLQLSTLHVEASLGKLCHSDADSITISGVSPEPSNSVLVQREIDSVAIEHLLSPQFFEDVCD